MSLRQDDHTPGNRYKEGIVPGVLSQISKAGSPLLQTVRVFHKRSRSPAVSHSICLIKSSAANRGVGPSQGQYMGPPCQFLRELSRSMEQGHMHMFKSDIHLLVAGNACSTRAKIEATRRNSIPYICINICLNPLSSFHSSSLHYVPTTLSQAVPWNGLTQGSPP